MSAALKPASIGTMQATEDHEAAVCALLVARGRLKDNDLARAKRLHEEAPEGTLTALLARLGLVSERDLAEAWSERLHAPLLAARDAPDMPPEKKKKIIDALHRLSVKYKPFVDALAGDNPADAKGR